MRKSMLCQIAVFTCISFASLAHASTGSVSTEVFTDEENAYAIGKIQQILKPESRTGTVILGENLATLKVPVGYQYLTASGANLVLESMWGNSHDESILGLIVPLGFPEDDKEWGVVLSYQDSGHISDSDANELLDSAKLLKSLQDIQTESNVFMRQEGLTPFDIVGWLANPSFDSVNKKLAWGIKMRSQREGNSESLNYQIRILGREGYMDLQGLGGVSELPKVQAESEKIMRSIEFNAGKKYSDYDASTDRLAEYGLIGLLGGGAIAKKIGVFALILKFWKIIAIAIVAFCIKMQTKIKALF